MEDVAGPRMELTDRPAGGLKRGDCLQARDNARKCISSVLALLDLLAAL